MPWSSVACGIQHDHLATGIGLGDGARESTAANEYPIDDANATATDEKDAKRKLNRHESSRLGHCSQNSGTRAGTTSAKMTPTLLPDE